MKTQIHRTPGTCSLASVMSEEQRKQLNTIAKQNKTA